MPTIRRQFGIFGCLLFSLTATAHAQGLNISIGNLTASQLTAGETADKVYFVIAGVDSFGSVVHPRAAPQQGWFSWTKYWPFKIGDSPINTTLYEGALMKGQSTFLVIVLRESDGSLAVEEAVALASPSLIGALSSTTSTLSDKLAAASVFVRAVSRDGDQTLGAIALEVRNDGGVFTSYAWSMLTAGVSTAAGASVNSFDIETYVAALYRFRVAAVHDPGTVLQVASSKMCLDLPNGSLADGVHLQSYPCHGGPSQRWLTPRRQPWAPLSFGESVRIISAHSGKCVDVPGASLSGGVRLQQFTCHGGRNQSFQIFGDPLKFDKLPYKNVNSQKCITESAASAITQEICQTETDSSLGITRSKPIATQDWFMGR